MNAYDRWFLKEVDERSVGRAPAVGAIPALVEAIAYLRGRTSTVFGSMIDPSKFEANEQLNAACETAVRAWWDEASERALIYTRLERYQIALGYDMPASVAAERQAQVSHAERIAGLGRPSETLDQWPATQQGLRALHTVLASLGDVTLTRYLGLPSWSSGTWEPIGDTWDYGEWEDPWFLPVAHDGGGNYLGLYLECLLLDGDIDAPLVYADHELDPPYTWVCKSGAAAAAIIDVAIVGASADAAAVGTPDPKVTELLESAFVDGVPRAREATHPFLTRLREVERALSS